MESILRTWRVPRPIIAVKLAGTAAFALVALWFAHDASRLVVAALAALLLGAYAVRDLLSPITLAVDTEGVLIRRGFFGQRRILWGQIERIRVDSRRRLAGRSHLLEIDVGETIYLFSRYEIGADPADVVDELKAARAGK
ncbi:PH domain-containing protein [Phytomonospora sp. NPDC050363]|uniref:PH domain-containing protein n=1 Tax=Phytomonospora sp. NPDC050363 TaxID=3155642 RepID=UPI0033D3BDAD